MKNGITFDTGALIALEEGQQRAQRLLWGAEIRGIRIVVPSPVVAFPARLTRSMASIQERPGGETMSRVR